MPFVLFLYLLPHNILAKLPKTPPLPILIFDKLEHIGKGAGGEIQLTDGIAELLAEKPVHAYAFSGERYDCGSKVGYLKASVAYGLSHPETGAEFRAHLVKTLCD